MSTGEIHKTHRRTALAVPFATMLAMFLPALSANVSAEIYRYVDENGKVHFSDQAPENRDAKNIKEDIDEAVKRNTLPSLDTQRENDPEWVKAARETRKQDAQQKLADNAERDQALKDWKRAVKDAKDNLKNARALQKAGEDAIEGDFIGKASGGARPSEKYHQRQIDLAARVKAAEEKLAELKKNKPKGSN